MKRQHNRFKLGFSILFLLLISIMSYYFYNSFELRKRSYINAVYSELSELENDPKLMAFVNSKEDSLYDYTIKLYENTWNEAEFRSKIQSSKALKSQILMQHIDSIFPQKKMEIAWRNQITSIVSLPNQDTLINSPLITNQTENELRSERKISTSKWETSNQSIKEGLDSSQRQEYDYRFIFNQEISFDILNINSLVIKELLPLLTSTIALLFLVLYIYFLTYRGLEQKRKETLQLHDSIDTLSHEFKTPLATLKIALKNQDFPTNLNLVERQIGRLESLLQQIDPSNHRQIQEWNYSNLREFIGDYIRMHPSICCELQIDDVKPLPQLSFTELESLFINLLDNAVKYGATKIYCAMVCDDFNLKITVQDNGPGIDLKEQKNIFKKFYRINQNNIHSTKGLGLGLYYINQIVEKNGGSVVLTSKLNQGTTFKIILPYA